MARGRNAQIAADMYNELRSSHLWGVDEAWMGIAHLLLTCQVQDRTGWVPLVAKGDTKPLGVVVYRESNDFKVTRGGLPNATVRKAERLSTYLAGKLGLPRHEVCSRIGQYWRREEVAGLQFHNLVGHAFRSIIVEILRHFGAAGLTYDEEHDARELFRGWPLTSRSKEPKIDILVLRERRPVAMLSTRWRYRHDRVDFIDEAHSYSAAADRMFGRCPYYAIMGEFSPSRVAKVLENVPRPIAAAIHFCPSLITAGLGENGRTDQLRDLKHLVEETHNW